MRRWLVLLALSAGLALPLLTPLPASAGTAECPDGYTPILLAQIEQLSAPPGVSRAAAAADDNQNGRVCFQFRGNFPHGGRVFKDDLF
jgi:hypothetical protein